MAVHMGYADEAVRDVRRAALLHDLGKLGVSNLILDKPEPLTGDEMRIVRRHPAYTHGILSRVGCFSHLSQLAASHHERLDGKGYHRGCGAADLDGAARLLCAADICDALRATRPYRAGLPADRILEIMARDVGHGIDGDSFAALRHVLLAGTPPEHGTVPAVRQVGALSEDYQQAA
jgi:HD-GYP domain-containing protein (c-di-GMP phosphodiesterase class II)